MDEDLYGSIINICSYAWQRWYNYDDAIERWTYLRKEALDKIYNISNINLIFTMDDRDAMLDHMLSMKLANDSNDSYKFKIGFDKYLAVIASREKKQNAA